MTITSARPRSAEVTLHDVAKEAGVSLATASRVLNGSTRNVAGSFRDRVQVAATRLGYTANASAQATARGTSAAIALLVADIADPYFGELAAGVAQGAEEVGLVVTIGITDRDPVREVSLVRALRGQRPRGVILAASRTTREPAHDLTVELERVTAAGGQVVTIGGPMTDARSVHIDNRGGAQSLGAAVAGLGYRDAVILAAADGVATSDERVAGFTAGFRSSGGSSPRIYRGAFTREAGAAVMADALVDGIHPETVIFGVNDVVAIGALSTLRAAGVRVGIDVALCGFDDISTSRDVTPALTTVAVPLESAGYQALRAVVDDDWSPGNPALQLEVLLRESTPSRR